MTAAEPLALLVGRLREAGVRAGAEEIADALWLARWIDPAVPLDDPESAGTTGPAAPPRPGPTPGPGPGGPDRPVPGPRPARTTVPLRPTGVPEGTASDGRGTVLVPVASAFPGLLPLERALRPFQRYRPRTPAEPGPLDEAATAEASARSGIVTPVFVPERRREARLLILMDDSPSMVVWDRMLEELRQVCEQVGAFRDVAVHRLRPHPDGVSVGVETGYHPDGGGILAPADGLRDPTGRTVTLLLSDCSGALWRRGSAPRMLHRWARTGPVAVLQPLPQRMWPRTLLPAEPGTLRRAGGSGGELDFTPRRRRRDWASAQGALPVPVLAPTGAALGGWARMMSGTAGGRLEAAAAWVLPGHPGAEPYTPPDRTPEQLVEDFQAVSSPAAQHLAVYLSATPLAYPVMQIVQRAMLPQTGPMEMAEVLLSGLLVRQEDGEDAARDGGPGATADRPAGPWYAFEPGVQDVLLRRLGLGEASLVLKHCSLYVERVFGRRAHNFPAVVVGLLSGANGRAESGDGRPVPVPEAFAEVARKVLLRFQPGGVGAVAENAEPESDPDTATPSGGVVIEHHGRALERARGRLERFRAHGTIRDLWEAIRLLRGAPDDETRPERTVPVRTLLAECLRHLWETRQDDGVLEEAERIARSACGLVAGTTLPAPQAAGAHQVLGRVLQAAARRHLGTPAAARTLAEAAGHLEHAYGLLRACPEPLLEVLLCLVEVARERYVLTADRRLLYGAQVRLDALLDSWPATEHPPSGAVLARGGLLMALAHDARERDAADEARALALQAAADFEAGAGLAGREGLPAAQICGARLDLAEARAMAVGDRGAPQVVRELRHALLDAGEDRDLQLTCLRRLAEAHVAAYVRTADVGELSAAEQAFARAQTYLPPDDPLRAELLTGRGEVLVEWASREGRLAVATDAVRALRAALAHTAESDPELPRRRLLFGRALRQRHELGGALTDLHEAEWILGRAARGACDDRTAAMAWLESADVLLRLAEDAGAAERRDQAAEAYRRAAESAAQAGDPLLGARAHHRRGAVLEQTAGPVRALESYRAAWELWRRAGAARDAQARSTLERMLALEDTA